MDIFSVLYIIKDNMAVIKDKTLKDNHDLKTIKDKNEYWKIVFLKTTKLTSALYLITNFLSDTEPLKIELRDKALSLLAAVHEREPVGSLGYIGHLIALLDIAMIGPMISVMNFSLVKNEYNALQQLILAEQAQATAIPFFGETKPPETPILPKTTPLGESSVASSEIDRRQVIIDFIKGQGWSSIRDIAGVVPNLSNKTVQRQLQNLVRDGVLKKVGDRRWSRYQLV